MSEKDSLHIEGRRWFQKSNGNTYHSVRIFWNGDCHSLPAAYGYEDQYLETAYTWLQGTGFFCRFREVSTAHGFAQWLRKYGYTYSVVDVARRSDL